MSSALDTQDSIALKFNGINEEHGENKVSLSATTSEWEEILSALERYENFDATLQYYTGISNIHANDVISMIRQAVLDQTTDVTLSKDDFVAVEALLKAFKDFGFGRYKDESFPPSLTEDRHQDISAHCSKIREEVEAAL